MLAPNLILMVFTNLISTVPVSRANFVLSSQGSVNLEQARGANAACAPLLLNNGLTEVVHRRITHVLFSGKVVSPLVPMGSMVFQVTLQGADPDTGETSLTKVVFKPRVFGDYNRRNSWRRGDHIGKGAGRVTMEYLVYKTNRLLGEDFVPPAAYRRGLDLHFWDPEFGDLHFTEGVFMYYVEQLEANDPSAPVLTPDEASLRENLAYVFRNPDFLHMGNSGRGRHWVDGVPRGVAFDWSASGSQMRGWQPPKGSYVAPGRRREAWRRLSLEDYRPEIAGGLVSEPQIRDILEHRDRLIAMSEEMDARGESQRQSAAVNGRSP